MQDINLKRNKISIFHVLQIPARVKSPYNEENVKKFLY